MRGGVYIMVFWCYAHINMLTYLKLIIYYKITSHQPHECTDINQREVVSVCVRKIENCQVR